jgi:hypothetical protein
MGNSRTIIRTPSQAARNYVACVRPTLPAAQRAHETSACRHTPSCQRTTVAAISNGMLAAQAVNNNGFLSVRSGPGVEFHEVDRVYDGQNFDFLNRKIRGFDLHRINVVAASIIRGCAALSGPCIPIHIIPYREHWNRLNPRCNRLHRSRKHDVRELGPSHQRTRNSSSSTRTRTASHQPSKLSCCRQRSAETRRKWCAPPRVGTAPRRPATTPINSAKT